MILTFGKRGAFGEGMKWGSFISRKLAGKFGLLTCLRVADFQRSTAQIGVEMFDSFPNYKS